jgi:hypothetical protein
MVEQAVAGLATITSWTTNSHTLTTANGTTSESRCAILVVDDDGLGQPSGAATVICPTASKIYIVRNICGQTATIKTAAGSGVAIPNNATAVVFCDGTNVLEGATYSNSVDINGGTIDGTTIGATTRSTGAFTTLTSNGATTFTAGIASTTTTTGTAVVTGGLGVSGRINAANFDGIVGANTAAAGSFTTLSASSTATLNTLASSGATLTGGTINNMSVGATTRSTGAFTTLASNAATTFTAGTASTTTGTGTVVVTGGLGVSGRINAANFDGIVGANTAAAGSFTTVGATTGNITTVNATTVDTTNLEVTSLKAKDGTAAGSIADATGIVTLASSVLTTTDINGGTVDNAAIGATTRSTGAFTTLTSNGATTFTANTASTTTTTGTAVITGGLGVSGRINAANFDGIVGANTAAAGSFTTLSASSTVSGTGFSTYLASPPAIGGTTAAAGSFTTLTTSSTNTLNALTASQAVFTNASKQLVSNAITGTGNVVMSASPTLTGTLTAVDITASGNIVGNGNWTLGNADTDTITVEASFVTGSVLRSAKVATNTLALAAYDVDGAAYTNLVTLTASNTPTLNLTSTGVGTINNMSVGATTRSTGAFTTLAANGATTFTAGTASTTTGTGTVVITGGLGVSGRINAANFDGIVGANTAAAGSFTTVGATTGNITTVNATTVDTTNLEVTTLKAKDGTAAGSIADTTGVVTINTLSTGGGNISPQTGFKNRIINGEMTIDQRNAGASVTQTTSNLYTVDRFAIAGSVASKFTAQQNAGSVTPPVGFINYLGCTSSSAYSVGAGENFNILHRIEGSNISDLGWGTANAQTITLFFWVRSSLTGTFGGSLRNSAADRSYPFAYTISSANTWEQKTITILGDTSGTWLTTTGIGIQIVFSLGAGATFSGTAGAWAGANYTNATGATSVVGTSGATFYITGVQFEKGSVATPFEFRSIGQEELLCERYCVVYGGAVAYERFGAGYFTSTTAGKVVVAFPTTMRTSPTLTTAGNFAVSGSGGSVVSVSAPTIDQAGANTSSLSFSGGSGLVSGNGTDLLANNSTATRLIFASEL